MNAIYNFTDNIANTDGNTLDAYFGEIISGDYIIDSYGTRSSTSSPTWPSQVLSGAATSMFCCLLST